MSNKAGNELEKSSARKRLKGAAPAPQEVAAVPTPAAAAAAAAAAPASAGEKWSVENGVLLLQTFLRILEDSGERPSYEQIHEAMHGSIPDDFSKEKVGAKLRSLKRKFLRAQSRATPPIDDPVYRLSERIWGGAAEAEAAAAVTPKAKLTPKPKTEKTPAVAAEQEETEAPAAVTPKAKPTPKRKIQKAPVVDAPQEAPAVVPPKAKPTPKRKTEKKPVVAAPQEEQEAAEVEEDTGRPRKSPRGHNNTPAPKPTPKRKTKKTPDAAAPEEEEEEAEVTGEDAGKPQKSPGDHNTTPAPRPKKEREKSKHLELVAAGRSSSELREGDNRHMLPGLVRLLQQVYPEADEKVVLVTLESMDAPRMEEIKEKWHRLQALKLEVASLTAQLAMDLTQSLH